jgi:hypothetical protein
MYKIVVLTHATSDFAQKPSMLRRIVATWRATGHDGAVVAGTGSAPDADVAILARRSVCHPEEYLRLASRCARVLNGGVTDTRKRAFSRLILRRDDESDGPVIVKTDLNSGGMPEVRAVHGARQVGKKSDPALLRLTASGAPTPFWR